MKKKLTLFIMFFIYLINIFSESYPIDILRKVDNLANFPNNDFSAEYTIVQDIPNEGRITTVAGVFRRDKNETYTIIISQPEINKGQGYLKQGSTLWFYDSDSRKYNSTSSKDKFKNSNARNSDFTSSTLNRDYKIISGERVNLGKYNCWLLLLHANSDDITYPIVKIWISDDNLVRKIENYSLSNQLLRTTVIPYYQNINDSFFPIKILYIEHLEGAVINNKFIPEKTQITISKPSLKDMPNAVFSKTFLESVNK